MAQFPLLQSGLSYLLRPWEANESVFVKHFRSDESGSGAGCPVEVIVVGAHTHVHTHARTPTHVHMHTCTLTHVHAHPLLSVLCPYPGRTQVPS